jgi:hypothetical protein
MSAGTSPRRSSQLVPDQLQQHLIRYCPVTELRRPGANGPDTAARSSSNAQTPRKADLTPHSSLVTPGDERIVTGAGQRVRQRPRPGVPLRGGRNARPVSSGPSGPTSACRAGWYFPPGEGIGRTRPGAGSRPRRGRFPPQDPRSRAIVSCNSWCSCCTLYSVSWHREIALEGSLQGSLDPPLTGPSISP